MSETASGLYFPDAADGWQLQWDTKQPVTFNTQTAEPDSGRVIRRERYPATGIVFVAGTVKPLTPASGQILRDFFIACRGRSRNFYFFLINPGQYIGISIGTGNGSDKNFVIPYRAVTFATVYDNGSSTSAYTAAPITKAEVVSTSKANVTVVAATNDTLGIKIDGGNTFTVTFSAGLMSPANFATALNANGTFSAVATADTSIDGYLRIQTKTTGRLGSVQIDSTVTHSAAALMNLDATIPHYTGQEVRIAFTSAPTNAHVLTADLSSARQRILAINWIDSLDQAFQASAVGLEVYPVSIRQVI